MNFIDKLERKFGRFGIPNLMRYIVLINVLGAIIGFVDVGIYFEYMALDIDQVLHGQVWRLVTFVLRPQIMMGDTFVDILWFALWLYVNYHIGLNLERLWGTFRFNLFYFSGVFAVVIITIATGMITKAAWGLDIGNVLSQYVTLDYLDDSLFLALACMFPNMEFYMYFILPIKAKWLSLVYVILVGYEFVICISSGAILGYFTAALIGISLLNCLLFYVFARGKTGMKATVKQKKRKMEFKQQAKDPAGPRHRCAICGRTEKDAPQLEFRYCSKCEGNYEYCSDHLFTHEHVHR